MPPLALPEQLAVPRRLVPFLAALLIGRGRWGGPGSCRRRRRGSYIHWYKFVLRRPASLYASKAHGYEEVPTTKAIYEEEGRTFRKPKPLRRLKLRLGRHSWLFE